MASTEDNCFCQLQYLKKCPQFKRTWNTSFKKNLGMFWKYNVLSVVFTRQRRRCKRENDLSLSSCSVFVYTFTSSQCLHISFLPPQQLASVSPHCECVCACLFVYSVIGAVTSSLCARVSLCVSVCARGSAQASRRQHNVEQE